MIFFFSGGMGLEKKWPQMQALVGDRLISYEYCLPGVVDYYISENRSAHIRRIMLDSGAFTAWNRGAVINFDDYIEFCKKHESQLFSITNLDVIPSKPGVKNIPTEEIERSASIGFRNAQKLLRAGIPKEKLIHVFHQNESFKWLEKMIREFEYIGLSPANDRSTQEKKQWLDECMNYVTDSDGYPIIKFHGFAVTAHHLMVRYPWYSIDSATWGQQAGRGAVYIPPKRNGKFDFLLTNPHMVRIGFNSPFEMTTDHYSNYPPALQAEFLEYFDLHDLPMGESTCVQVEKKTGPRSPLRFCRSRQDCDQIKKIKHSQICQEVKIEEGLINSNHWRCICNAHYMVDFLECVDPWPTRKYQKERQMDGFGLLG